MDDCDRRKTTCLGIPTPTELRELAKRPAAQRPLVSTRVDQTIRAFGKLHRRSEDEIEKACDLAHGVSDMVVLLERPRDKHKYAAAFEDLVNDCATLQAVDEMVRFVTNGKRSISDTVILDAFSFKPKKEVDSARAPSDQDCLDVAMEVLRIIKSDVVLTCCTPDLAHHELTRLVRFKDSHKLQAPQCMDKDITGRRTKVVGCFHLSYYINRMPQAIEPKARLTLALAFKLAFTPDISQEDMAAVANFRKKYHLQNTTVLRNNIPKLELLQRLREAHRISTISTTDSECSDSEDRPVGNLIPNRTPETDEEVFDLLWTLPQVSRTDSGMLVMELCLLWQCCYRRHPLQDLIQGWMVDLYHKQTEPDLRNRLANCSDNLLFWTPWADTCRSGDAAISKDRCLFDKKLHKWRRQIAEATGRLNILCLRCDEVSAQLAGDRPSVAREAHQQLAEECKRELRCSVVTLNTSIIHLRGEVCSCQCESQPHRAVMHRPKAKSLADEVLKTVDRLRNNMTNLLEKVGKLEDKSLDCGALGLGTHTMQRVSTYIQSSSPFAPTEEVRSAVMALRMELAAISLTAAILPSPQPVSKVGTASIQSNASDSESLPPGIARLHL
ncbi:uncharacterized protein LTR77_005973 [Saxophila tyrrhenica]|uniref:Uncharacterized protein n=1 Tax=Saxophila tyrrhenica TaxID=1690608 RepID=A0AAV9P9M8_9PEZI|nr:hypothetical protein LTR77_005973 [Saxophila tyrrhenica]